MDEQINNKQHTYSGILFNPKKERNSITYYSLDEP